MISPFPKPHPNFKPRLSPRPRYERLPKEPRMTIALGIIGQQCAVVGADMQETWGSEKYHQGKIMSAWRGDPASGAICVSGAGAATHIDAAAQELVAKFQKFTGTMEELEAIIKKHVKDFYLAHVMPFIGRTDDVPDFQLLIVVRHAHQTAMWITSKTVTEKVGPYAVIGISRGSSQALLGQVYKPFPSLNVASLLAAYVIRQAKLGIDGIGLESEIRFIFREGIGFVPPRTVRKWEEVFEEYQYLQREIFGYLSGFRELKIRLPGSVVPSNRELKDMVKDLKKMQAQLAKFPVIKGLDEPTMRSTSEMSDLGL